MVISKNNNLIYASRSTIPGSKNSKVDDQFYKQVAIYGFTPEDLSYYGPEKKKSQNEKIEDIEILRLIEKDIKIGMVKISSGETAAIDVYEDIERVKRILRKNK